jgi:hypothetical protein
LPLGDGLYKLLEPVGYDPEDELWQFLPGAIVRLKESTFYTGEKGLLAKHPGPSVVTLYVPSTEEFAPRLRQTLGLPVGENAYKVMATPHYTPEHLWEFPPGSVVRAKVIPSNLPGPLSRIATELAE